MAGLTTGSVARGWRAALAVLMLWSMALVPMTASAQVHGLPGTGILQGTVTDPDGLPVRYACIELYQWNAGDGAWEIFRDPMNPWNDEYAQTLDDGTYYAEVDPGTYRMRIIDRYGDWEYRDWLFVTEFYNNRTTIDSASNVIITGGLTTTCDIQVVPEEYGTGAGVITDAVSGAGAYSVGVSFYRYDGIGGWEWVQGGGSNSLGDWMTESIPSGSYKVEFTDDYGRYCTQWFGDTTFSASPTVTIAPDYVTSGIDAVMDRSSSISGNVQRANVAPAWVNAIGVWPLVYRWDVDEGAWTEANDTGLQEPTDASGNYTVTGLDAGQYKIRFVPDTSYLTFNHFIADQVYGAPTGAKLSPSSPAEWSTYEAQLSAGTTITLAANTDLTGIDDQCPWGGYLTGQVTYAAGGAPVPDYHVSVWDTSGLTFVGDTWTDASGNWEFRDLDDVPDYKVMFDDESGSLTGGDPGYFYNTEWYNGAGSPAAATSVGFGPGSGQGGINAAIDSTTQWGNVTGKVTDLHTGKALEGVIVGLNLWNTDTPGWVEQHSTTTDASGRYTFTKVPWAAPFNAAVRISAYEDECNTTLDIGRPYDTGWANGVDLEDATLTHGVIISAGATATANIQMPLRPTCEWDPVTSLGGIVGTVTADAAPGVGVPGVPVTFYQDGGGGEWWYVGQRSTNASGAYSTGLAVGSYRLEFGPTVALSSEYYNNTSNFASATVRTVVATPGAYATADAALGAAFTISGTVRDGSGAALEGAEVRTYAYDSDWDVWAPVSYDQGYASVGAAVALTDASGHYTVGGLKAGVDYRIGFSKWSEGDDYPPDWNRVYWRQDGTAQSIDQATNITLGPSTTGKDATLTAGSYLRGSLVDQDGKRVGPIHVKLWQKGPGDQWNQINSTYSSTQGDFEFTGFGAGDYYLKFEDDANFLYGTQWYRGGSEASSSGTAVTFTGGETRIVTDTVLTVATDYSPIFGATRYDTAVNAAYEAFPMGASTVVISTGQNWPDALGGSALAGAYDGPMLLVSQSSMPAAVGDCIDDLGATKAIIIGGTGAVSQAVATQIASHVGGLSHVTRIAGANRYDTANLVAAATIARLGAAYDGTAFVATGGNFPDALGASPLAASASWPLYLANPTTGLDSATLAQMAGAGVDHVLIIGGTGAVAPGVETALNTQFGDANVERLAGSNRYHTAAIIAQYGVDNCFGLGWNNVAFATGTNFPDALAGGVLQGMTGSVLLLTGAGTLDPSVAAVLDANRDTIAEVRFLGGPSAVSDAVKALIYSHLN